MPNPLDAIGAPPAPVTLRSFNDVPAQRQAIYDSALEGVQQRFPLKSATHSLEVSDLGYEDYNPTRADEKKALLTGGRLQRAMHGTVTLKDAAGKTLDQKRTIVAHVPHLTADGVVIHNGTRWGIRNQQRLRSGVYVRKQKNGGTEAHINAKPGTGRGFRINLDPTSGLFKLQVEQSTTRLYPLMKALGVSDEALKKHWGEELFHKNWREVSGHDVSDLRKTVSKLGRTADGAVADQDLPATLKAILDKSHIDPDVNETTLGARHEHPHAQALVDATRKILDVANGRHEGDNRDSQSYQSTHSAEDFIKERLARDPSNGARKLLWDAQRTGTLDKLHSGLLTPSVHSLYRSGLASALEDINPLEIYDHRQSITRMGEGGIGSERAVSRDARGVQPSYLGMIDGTRTPESSKIGLDLRVTNAALKGSDGQMYVPLQAHRGAHEGIKPVSARTMAKSVVAFPGEMAKGERKVRALINEQIRYVDRAKVDYELPDASGMFSGAANLIPLHHGEKSGRLLMGSRMLGQALPLVNPEAPLVQSVDADGQSFYKTMGKAMGAVHADRLGTVSEVTPDAITVKHFDGTTKTHSLYNHYPLARKTMLHNTASVKAGDMVAPGQLLAKSNFTDDKGVAAPGTNLRVAYLSGHGGTYEDAIVISESAAKKLTSEHHYKHSLDLGPHIQSMDTAKYRAVYGDKYTPEQYKKLGEDGVIKPGTVVNPGDPLLVGMAHKEGRAIGALMKGSKTSYTDISQTWDHPQPGVITDVTRTKGGLKVAVKTYEPMTIGSKATQLYGGKGVVSRIVPDAQMPHDKDGNPVEMLQSPFGIITRGNPAALAATLLGKVAHKRGAPFQVKSFDGKHMTKNALDEARNHGVGSTEDLTDPTTGRALKNVFTGHQYILKLHHTAESKIGARDTGGYSADESPSSGGEAGCFVAKTRILTSCGYEDIGYLCEKRRQVPVLTYSQTLKEWVYRPITDWFTYRAKTSDIRNVSWVGPSVMGEKVNWSLQCFNATVNHRVVLASGEYTTVGELKPGDHLVSWGAMPTQHQKSALLGTMLGDAALVFDELDQPYGFQFEHSVKQTEYAEWKADLFSGLGATWCHGDHAESEIRGRTRGRVRSRQTWFRHPYLAQQVHALGYAGAEKRVSAAWVEQIDELAIVIWFLDDGSLCSVPKKAGTPRLMAEFATHSFTEAEVRALRERIESVLGITCGTTLARIGGSGVEQYKITVSNLAGCMRLADAVARWVPVSAIPRSKKWLRAYVGKTQLTAPPQALSILNRLEQVPVKIRAIKPYVHDKPGVDEINVYDITVEDTHAYIASSALVSNSKRVGLLDVHALLSSGATEFLKDAKLVRGQRNDDYWRALKMGHTPIAPTKSFAHEHFQAMLKSAGVKLGDAGGGKQRLGYLTDGDIDKMAQHEIGNSGTFDFKTMQPIKDGLFDLGKTGGADGTRYSKITLPEKIPNPLAEPAITRILDLTGKRFEGILSGKETLNGMTGPAAIEDALKNLPLERALQQARDAVRGSTGAKRDAAIKRLGYLDGLQKQGIAPEQLMISKLPVLPPKYRPITRARNMDVIHDANYLYHDLMEAATNVHAAKSAFGESGNEYLTMYKAAKAVVGLHDPVNPKHVDQGVKGLLRYAIGVKDSPKYSRFQRKVLGNSVDTVGRSVVTIDPNLDMDSMGMPEDMAWTQFRPFVIRRLVRSGMPASEAVKAVRDRTPHAEKQLEAEMAERPVVYNRAPSLHRYNYIGAMAKLVKGSSSIAVPQTITKGAGMDFDGDAINVHVPVGDKALQEVKDKLFPSKNLIHPNSFDVHHEPSQEFLAGLYLASEHAKKAPRTFLTRADAEAAEKCGEIGPSDPIEIVHPS